MKTRALITLACLSALTLLTTGCDDASAQSQQSTSDARGELAAAFQASSEEKSSRVSVITGDALMVTETDRDAKVVRTTTTTTSNGHSSVTEVLLTGGFRYTRSHALGDTRAKWSKTAASDTPQDFGGPLFRDFLDGDPEVTRTSSGSYRVISSGGGTDLLTGLPEGGPGSLVIINLDSQGRVVSISTAGLNASVEYGVTVAGEPPAEDEIES